MHARHRRRLLLPILFVLALGLADVVRAGQGDKPLERKDLDHRIYAVLRDVINAGADLYNVPVGDRAGCYRLYQGALLTVRPLLDHHPELQKEIDAGLAKANTEPSNGLRAHAVRAVIDKIRDTVGTLWERLGEEKGVTKVVDDFVDLAAKNPKTDFTRGGKYKPDAKAIAELKQRLVEMVSEATGGPLKYKGKSMAETHKGMNITDAEFDALAADLKTTLQKNNVKDSTAAELLKIVEMTRKDIVGPKKPEEKKPEEKKPEEKKEEKPGQVKGKIVLQGKPLAGAVITLVPAAEPAAKGVSAVSQEDGTFEIKDGIKPGAYRVTVADGEKKGAVPPKYGDAKTSPLEIAVKNGSNEIDLLLAP